MVLGAVPDAVPVPVGTGVGVRLLEGVAIALPEGDGLTVKALEGVAVDVGTGVPADETARTEGSAEFCSILGEGRRSSGQNGEAQYPKRRKTLR